MKAERDEELARLGLLKTVPKKTAAPTASSSNENVVDFDNNNPDGRMLEDIIEDMRRKLPANRTPVTPETFAVWYAKKKKEKAEKSQKKQSKREKDIALGRVAMTGRELFERKRNVFIDDDRADEDHYDKDDTAAVFVASLEEQMRMDAEVNGVEFDEEKFKVERDKVLQRIKEDRDAKVAKSSSSSSAPNSSSAPPTSDASSANINVDALGTVPPIDESLFNEEDIPDDIDDEDDEEENVEEEE